MDVRASLSRFTLATVFALGLAACGGDEKKSASSAPGDGGTDGAVDLPTEDGGVPPVNYDCTPSCASGEVCVLGECQVDTGQSTEPPADPTCYTPCRGGTTCSEEGLTEGCIAGLECFEGTCVPPQTKAADDPIPAAALCANDAECARHQVCIQGQCYSDCKNDADCRLERICIAKVCRLPCTATETGACGDGYACELSDGTSGFCMPVVPPTDAIDVPPGSFTVDTGTELVRTVAFTNTNTTDTFTITNDSPGSQTFEIKKIEHRAFNAITSETDAENPLSWLSMAAGGAAATTERQLRVTVGGGESVVVTLSGAANPEWDRWDADLVVSNPALGDLDVSLSFKSGKQGQWAGHMYFIAANFGTEGLDDWLLNKFDATATSVLGNAFIQRWTAFRDNEIIEQDFNAMIQATETGSWQWTSVIDKCPRPGAPNPNLGCYLSNTPNGVSVFSDSLQDFPIPSGVSRLPIVMNLHADATEGPTVWTGRIDSKETMHYPGDPAVRIAFNGDPVLCDGEDETCKTFITEFGANVVLGGRYPTTASGSCRAGYRKVATPWLPNGFAGGSESDGTRSYVYECRNQTVPGGALDELLELNANASGANPIPDGASRSRSLELVDGAMIRGDEIFIIFRERMPSFVDPSSPGEKVGYGYIVLKPVDADLDPEDYDGTTQVDTSSGPPAVAATCSAGVISSLRTALGDATLALDSTTAPQIGLAVVAGIAPNFGSPLAPADVHYLCQDTGQFDSVGCTASARRYLIEGNTTLPSLAAETCMATNSCLDTYLAWIDSGAIVVPIEGACPSGNPGCTVDFYAPSAASPAFASLDDAIDAAFAYSTEFQSNRGSGAVGFAPKPCDGSTTYCYDPSAIEEIAARIDCARLIYTDYFTDIDGTPAQPTMKDALTRAFGWESDGTTPGFERRLAQLLTMLGDDEYAATFTTRFDLSGQLTNASFQGSLFEVGGSDFTGPAGFEMNSLYRSAQYYGQVVDRFFKHALYVEKSLRDLPAGAGYVTDSTASAYVERLLIASSQKSRAWTEVAKRYQAFNLSELATRVLGRAFAATFVESVVLSDLLDQLSTTAPPTTRAQLIRQIEQAQRVYKVAMLDMHTANRQIKDEVTVFGFAPEYVPFPVLDTLEFANAFAKALDRAEEKAGTARTAEDRAISDATNYAGSEVEFLGELDTINTNFESQLAEICGTFEGADGTIYAAIPAYAEHDPRAMALGDPCGFMGNGAINDAMLELQQAALDVNAVAQRRTNLLAEIADANAKVQTQCANITNLKNITVGQAGKQRDLEAGIAGMNIAIDAAHFTLDQMSNFLESAHCNPPTAGTAVSPGNCIQTGIATSVYVGAAIGVGIGVAALQAGILGAEVAIANSEIDVIKAQFAAECQAAQLDTAYEVLALDRSVLEVGIDAAKVALNVRQISSQILKLRNDAASTYASWEQAKSIAIDIAAAWTDPNVRIYKNDAIINAERSFESAIREAYVATKVFEYFTSQSYADLEKLFLIRMVQFGNPSLDQYLSDLDDAFAQFQQVYGVPENRVMVVSLVNDILQLSHLGETNGALKLTEHRKRLRELLSGSQYRDGEGRLVFPFATLLDNVSPLTFNHKLSYIEAEIVPQLGDNQARVYLVQRGTGSVKNTQGTLNFLSLPRRQAVVDAFFDGEKPLAADVYTNETLRDRPLINAAWDLVIDPQAESVNRDFDLGELDDIRLYLYYNDFTTQ